MPGMETEQPTGCGGRAVKATDMSGRVSSQKKHQKQLTTVTVTSSSSFRLPRVFLLRHHRNLHHHHHHHHHQRQRPPPPPPHSTQCQHHAGDVTAVTSWSLTQPYGSYHTIPIHKVRKRGLRKCASRQASQPGSRRPAPKQDTLASRLAGDAQGVFRLAGWLLAGASSFICEMCANKGNHGSWVSSKEAKEKWKQAVHAGESASGGWHGRGACGKVLRI